MKNSLLFLRIILLLSPFIGFTQNIDSLWRVHNNPRLHDTIRLSASEVLLRFYQTNYKIDTALVLSEKQIELARSSKDSSWIAFSFYNHGYTNMMNDQFRKAIVSYKKALAMYKRKKSGNYGGTLNNIAYGYYKLAEYDSSNYFYNTALIFFTEVKDTFDLGRTYNQLALINDEEGNIMLSLDYYFKALKTFESINNDHGISVTYINIAGCYEELNDKILAREYYEKAYKIKVSIGDELGTAISLANLSNFFLEEQKYDTAISCLRHAIVVYKKFNQSANLANSYSGLGSIYLTMKKYELAAKNYELGISTARESDYNYGLARFLAAYGKLFVKTKNYSDAIKYCSEGLEASMKTGQLDGQRSNCECLAAAYENTGDFEKALTYHKRFVALRDSITNEDNKKEAVRKVLTFNFTKTKIKDSLEFAQKDMVNAMKISEQQTQMEKDRTQRYALYGGMTLLLFLGLVSYRSYVHKKKDNLIISKQKDEVEKQKHIVEEKQKEILDSIHYAKRIQLAQIPSEKRVFSILTRMIK